VKSSNIFLTSDMNAYLGDYGSSVPYDNSYQFGGGTFAYQGDNCLVVEHFHHHLNVNFDSIFLYFLSDRKLKIKFNYVLPISEYDRPRPLVQIFDVKVI
jgi:hypothetical protein